MWRVYYWCGPKPEEALMTEGMAFLYGRSDPAGAADRFRKVLALNPTHYGAHYQLAVALDKLGDAKNARPLWEQVLRMAQQYNDVATMNTAQTRLQKNP